MKLATPRTQSAFSLLEVLFVIGIILLVFVLYWGPGTGNKAKEKKILCRQNLEKLYIPLQIYANEHQDNFPNKPGALTSEEPLDLLVPKYTADTSFFICPGTSDSELPSGESILKHKISYAYYMGRKPGGADEPLASDWQVNTLAKSNGASLFSTNGKPPGNNHKTGGNFLFCDGHVDSSASLSSFSLALPPGVVLLNPKNQ